MAIPKDKFEEAARKVRNLGDREILYLINKASEYAHKKGLKEGLLWGMILGVFISLLVALGVRYYGI